MMKLIRRSPSCPTARWCACFRDTDYNETTGDPNFSLAVIRSTDRGQTWSGRIDLAQTILAAGY